jgi:ribosomal protein L12E/L44/L45/RPP1/RPP2
MKTNWKYKEHLAQVAGLDGGNCDVLVAKVYGKDAEEVHEHGTLIAAAPEMLELLKVLLNDVGIFMKLTDNEKVKALLAKVEGRS